MLLGASLSAIPARGQQANSASVESLLASAKQAQINNDLTSAASFYRQALRLQPSMAELWANLGLVQYEQHDYSASIESLRHAYQMKPTLYVPNLFLGIDFVRTDQPAEAIPYLKRAEQINGSDPQASLALGHAYFAQRDYLVAAAAYQRVLRLDARNSSAWFDLGLADTDLVETEARKLLSGPTNPYGQLLFAESLMEQSRFTEATEKLQQVTAMTPPILCAQAELGFALLGKGNAAEAKIAFERDMGEHSGCRLGQLGMAALDAQSGSIAEAVKLLEALSGQDAGFVASRAALLQRSLPPDAFQALLQAVAAQAGEASPLYAALSGQVPERPRVLASAASPAARLPLAKQAFMQGRYAACVQQMAGARTPEGVPEALLLARCASFTGDYEISEHAAERAQTLNPQSTEARYWLIKAAEKLALASFEQFEQIAPDSEKTHLLLGDIYRQRQRYSDAEAQYKDAASAAPGDIAPLYGLASCYFVDSKVDQAMAIAQQALGMAPSDADLNLLVAEILVSRHEWKDAEPYLAKSTHVKPQIQAHVHTLLGEVYEGTDRPADAIREYLESLNMQADQDGTIHYRLGRLYQKLGNNTAAAAEFGKVRSIQQARRDRAVVAIQDSGLPSNVQD